MYLAQLFDGKSNNTLLSVRRRWPIIEGSEVDSTFYESPVLVQYDQVKRTFKTLDDSGKYSILDPRFLKDNAWKISNVQNVKISNKKKAKDMERAIKTRTFPSYEYVLESKNGVLICQARRVTNFAKKLIFLRV